eukprot:4671296-Alexandrium_andersonii.AAC.1
MYAWRDVCGRPPQCTCGGMCAHGVMSAAPARLFLDRPRMLGSQIRKFGHERAFASPRRRGPSSGSTR